MNKDNNLQYPLEKSKGVKMTPSEVERQRRSFAYGNTNIENERVTKRIDEQADKLGSVAASG